MQKISFKHSRDSSVSCRSRLMNLLIVQLL